MPAGVVPGAEGRPRDALRGPSFSPPHDPVQILAAAGGAAWAELLTVEVGSEGWQSARWWIRWVVVPGTPPAPVLQVLLTVEGPQGEQADLATWIGEARGALSACVAGAWRIRVWAQTVAAAGALVQTSWARYPWPEPTEIPPPAGALGQRLAPGIGADTIVQPLRGQRLMSVQLLTAAPVQLLIAKGWTTNVGALGELLAGAPAPGAVGGYWEEEYAGPLALRAVGGASAVQISQQ